MQSLLETKPPSIQLMRKHAISLLKTQLATRRFEEAIAVIKHSMALLWPTAEMYLDLAECSLQLGDPQLAEQACQEALARDANCAEAYFKVWMVRVGFG